MLTVTTPTPADLRAQAARVQVEYYVLAARVGVHPGRFGQMLGEKIPMPVSVAERAAAVLRELEGA